MLQTLRQAGRVRRRAKAIGAEPGRARKQAAPFNFETVAWRRMNNFPAYLNSRECGYQEHGFYIARDYFNRIKPPAEDVSSLVHAKAVSTSSFASTLSMGKSGRGSLKSLWKASSFEFRCGCHPCIGPVPDAFLRIPCSYGRISRGQVPMHHALPTDPSLNLSEHQLQTRILAMLAAIQNHFFGGWKGGSSGLAATHKWALKLTSAP